MRDCERTISLHANTVLGSSSRTIGRLTHRPGDVRLIVLVCQRVNEPRPVSRCARARRRVERSLIRRVTGDLDPKIQEPPLPLGNGMDRNSRAALLIDWMTLHHLSGNGERWGDRISASPVPAICNLAIRILSGGLRGADNQIDAVTS